MTMKSIRILQNIALVLAAAAAIVSCLAAVKPEWIGITGLQDMRAVPTSSLVASIGFLVVDIFYLVLVMRAKVPGGSKAAVIVCAALLGILIIAAEPAIYARESQLLQVQTIDPAQGIAYISITRGVREFVRLVLFASAVFSFISMGGFRSRRSDEKNEEEGNQ